MTAQGAPIRLFIDGHCPLCRREGAVIARLDRGRGLVSVEDLNATGFDPAGLGLTHAQMMGALHAQLPDGRIVTGLEVFRRVYRSLAWWGVILAPTGWPLLRPMFDAAYRLFARHRIRIGAWFGGRTDCADGSCRVEP